MIDCISLERPPLTIASWDVEKERREVEAFVRERYSKQCDDKIVYDVLNAIISRTSSDLLGASFKSIADLIYETRAPETTIRCFTERLLQGQNF